MVRRRARLAPNSQALRGPDGALTYAELDALADRIARALAGRGVAVGDRVGIWLDKSGTCVAVMQAALRLGAVYVPLDPMSPASRVGTVIDDCAIRCLVTTHARANEVLASRPAVECLCVDGAWGDGPHWDDVIAGSAEPVPTPDVADSDLAYILYTSGSTGRPKGVCISHRNALAFIEWAAVELRVDADDRLANHAPFHFDLSVLDLYVTFYAGASVTLIPEGASYAAERLVELVQRERLTIWYSVPSALILMLGAPGMICGPDLALRAILFAGEPFPIRPLRELRRRFPQARLLNLYGPTETNVCTFHEVHELDDDRTLPVPIGRACSGDEVWAVRADGAPAGVGEEGELMVRGPTVMLGYWGATPQGALPYATGDIVRLEAEGDYVYIGRRDHMVKVRGHRVELGDIEAALSQHDDIREAAVIVRGSGLEARLVAFVVAAAAPPPSLLALKRHCAERLPRYMIIDHLEITDALPRTRNGKVDRLALTRAAEATHSSRGTP